MINFAQRDLRSTLLRFLTQHTTQIYREPNHENHMLGAEVTLHLLSYTTTPGLVYKYYVSTITLFSVETAERGDQRREFRRQPAFIPVLQPVISAR